MIKRIYSTVGASLKARNVARRTRHEIGHLDAYLLEDIGLGRSSGQSAFSERRHQMPVADGILLLAGRV